MVYNGFLRVPRNFFTSSAWKIPRKYSEFEAYLDLLQQAAWRPMQYYHKGKYFAIEEGDLITLSSRLAQRWGWPKDEVKRWLHKLADAKVLSFAVTDGVLKISLDAYCNTRFADLKPEFWSEPEVPVQTAESAPPAAPPEVPPVIPPTREDTEEKQAA